MNSASGLVIGLSLVFGCLFLALAAELYYLLWWKKRITNRESETEEESYTTSSNTNSAAKHAKEKEFLHFVCWKKPTAQPDPNQPEPDLERGGDGKDSLLVKEEDGGGEGEAEESVESELMRLHNLAGPPRFLFTIKEEEKEDLESECDKRSRKGSRTRSLSDILMAVDTSTAPLFTPLASPRCTKPLDSYNRQGFNPLFESSMESMRPSSSPPPKFKFLRDAEEKLLRRLLAESAGGQGESESKPLFPAMAAEVREGSFLGFLYAKNSNRDAMIQNHRLPQVIPLATSPSGDLGAVDVKSNSFLRI
ncbi:hypothetical protein LINPERHAP2_LOCUS17559 [Linum perenne]